MVLFFICGVIAGAVVTRLYITYKNDNSKEFAKACAYEGEDSGMCLYIPKECFEGVKE